MPTTRILFVDDEDGIRETLPTILRMHDFDVISVGTVAEALAEITGGQFDVLLSDLNIGQAGDGFTVVSAMRRTQPNCITMILTGYPGFESALQAIRRQVDDYLIKPTSPSELVGLIQEKLKAAKGLRPVANKRIAAVLRENVFEIASRTLAAMKVDPDLRAVPLNDEERLVHIPRLLEGLAGSLEAFHSAERLAEGACAARASGRARHGQGYSIPLIAKDGQHFQHAVYDVIHENMLSLNLSYLMLDLKRLNDILASQLQDALRGFLEAEHAA